MSDEKIFIQTGLTTLLSALLVGSPFPAIAATIPGGFKQIDMEDGSYA